MRNFLTFVAVALVTALMVALAAPPLVDWTARRVMVARAISVRIDAPVRISGPISLRLLPTPYLEIANVSIGPNRAPWLTGRSMRVEFGLSSLFGGDIALDEVAFDRPTLTLGPRLTPPSAGRLAFGHIRADHAEIRVERSGAAPILLHDVSFDGAAPSGRGPWRGAGDFALAGGGRGTYQFASEAFQGDALPLRGEIVAGSSRAELDGRLALGETPSFAGTAAVDGETPAPDGETWPWRVAGEVVASGDAAEMAAGDVRLGPDARALQATGRLALRFGERSALEADLKAKALNVDALLRKDRQTFVPPARAAAALSALAGRSLGRDAPDVSLKLQAETVYLGARRLAAPELTLVRGAGASMQVRFSSALPGRARAAFEGAMDLSPAPILRGRGQGEVGDFAALTAWVAEGQPDLAARMAALGAALPQGDISAAGELELSSEGYSVRGLKLGVGTSRFDGDIVYHLPAPQRRARLFLNLTSPALDIDAAPNVEAAMNWLGGADLDLHLRADALRVARLGEASVSGGSLSVRAVRDGDAFALKQFSLADLGGASIEAEGESTPTGRSLRVKLDAGRLGDFAALLARAAPGALTSWFEQRAGDLGAARATFEARRDGPGPLAFDLLKCEGAVAGAHFALTFADAPAPVDAITAQATVDSPDAGGLLRKLGLKAPPGPVARGELALSGVGRWDRGFDGKARFMLAGSELTWTGAFRPEAQEGSVVGSMALKSPDLAPALAALGAGAAGAILPVDLKADVEAGWARAQWSNLTGSLAGSRLTGDLAFTPHAFDPLAPSTSAGEAAPAAVTGKVALDRASLAGLLSGVLGRAAPARPGTVWPDSPFGPALASPPSVDVALDVGALDLGVGVGRAMTARLQMDRDRVTLANVSTQVNGGVLGGHIDVRRGPTQATASGALSLTGVGVERSGYSARLDASLDFAGAGDSVAALIGGLAGGGRLNIDGAKIPRLDAQALARVFAKIERAEGSPPEEAKLESLLGAELDKAPLSLAPYAGALALSSGALRFGPLAASSDAGATRVSAVFGLARLVLALDAEQTTLKVGRFWSGPPPQIEVTVKGAPDAPTRTVEADLLSTGLAAEAIARETERIANFEADVRERAMFNRKRKAQAFLDRRAAEIAAYLDARERRRLMERYQAPYAEWGDSRSEAPELPPAVESRPAKDAAGL